MFFRTEPQIHRALEVFGESVESVAAWERPGSVDGTISVQNPSGKVTPSHWLSIVIPKWFSPAHGWLLWVSQTGIFPSSELLHLYYTLRTSHGNHDDIKTSPGHEFLGYETSDLRSFLFVTISSGWDAHLITYGGPGRAFFSHDGWFRFSLDSDLLPGAIEDLKDVNAEYGT